MRRTVLCVLFALLVVLFTSSSVFATIQEDDEAQVMASELAYLQQAFVQTHHEVAEEADTLFWQELGQKFKNFGKRIKAKFQSIFKPKNGTATATPNTNAKVISNNATESSPSAQVPQWLKSTKLPAYVRDAIVRLKNLHLKVKSFEELKNTHKPISDQEVKVGLSELLNHVDSKDKKARRNAIGTIVRAAKKANKHKSVKKLHKIQVKILNLKDKLEDLKTKKQQEEKAAPATPTDATTVTPAPVPEAAAQKEAAATTAPVKTEDKIAELKQKIKANRVERTKKLKKLVEVLNQEADKKKQTSKKTKKTKKPKKDNKKRGRKPRVFVAKNKSSKKQNKKQKKQKKNKKNINKAFKRLFEKIKSHYKKAGLKTPKKAEEPKEKPVEAKKPEEPKPVEVKKPEEKPAEIKKAEDKPVQAVEAPVEVKNAKKAEKKKTAKVSKKEQKKTEQAPKKEHTVKPKASKKKQAKRIPTKSEVAEAIQRLIDRVETLRNQGSAKYFSLIVKLKKVNRLVQSAKPDTQRLNTFLTNLIKRSGVVHPKIPEVMKKLRTVINASLTAGEQATTPVQPAKSTAAVSEKTAAAVKQA